MASFAQEMETAVHERAHAFLDDRIQHLQAMDAMGCHGGHGIPSGKLLHNYGKPPFIVSFPMKHGDFP